MALGRVDASSHCHLPYFPKTICKSFSSRLSLSLIVSLSAQQLIADRLLSSLPLSASVFVVNEDQLSRLPIPQSSDVLPTVGPSSLLYIVFTSDSTGRPKGVSIRHSNLSSAVKYQQTAHNFKPDSRVYDFASYAFDIAWINVLHTFTAGGVLCIPSEEDRRDNFSESIVRLGVTYAEMTPTMAYVLSPETAETLQTIVLGGEKAHAEALDRFPKNVELKNTYGPSGCTPTSQSLHDYIQEYEQIRTELGTPLLHARLVQQARGNYLIWTLYHALFDGRSIPLMLDLLETIYHAEGDLSPPSPPIQGFVRHIVKGDQEQIRAFWDSQLSGLEAQPFPALPAADYQPRPTANAQVPEAAEGCVHELIASTTKRQPAADAIHAWDGTMTYGELDVWSSKLTGYLASQGVGMGSVVPLCFEKSVWTPVAMLAVIKAGAESVAMVEADAEAHTLSELTALNPYHKEQERRPPTTEAEQAIQELWSSTLGIDPDTISADDSFLRIGGDSVSAMRVRPLLSDLATVVGTLVEPNQQAIAPFSLLRSGTDARQTQLDAAKLCSVKPEQVQDVFPCTPLQEGLLALTARRAGDYVAQEVLKLRQEIDISRFQDAWHTWVANTPILRTRIIYLPGQGLVQVAVDDGYTWPETAVADSEFWSQQLQDLEAQAFPALPLPNYRPDSRQFIVRSISGRSWPKTDVTPTVVLRAALSVIIAQHTGLRDVILGTTVAGRHVPVPGVERIVGPTIATVPLRVRLDYSQSATHFLAIMQEQMAKMIEYESPRLSDLATSINERCQIQVEEVAPFSLLQPGFSSDDVRAQASKLCSVAADQVQDVFPCTPLQQGLLALTAKRAGDYVGQEIFTLHQTIDIARFKEAWDTLVAATPILRTRIIDLPGQGIVQVVVQEESDRSTDSENAGDLKFLVGKDRLQSMGLGAPLTRCRLVHQASHHHLVWTIHHALCDGWSLLSMLKSLEEACNGKEASSAVPFQGFVAHMINNDPAQAAGFWGREMEGLEELAERLAKSPGTPVIAVGEMQISQVATQGDAKLPTVARHGPLFVLFTSGTTGTPKGVIITHSNFSSTILHQHGYFGYDNSARVYDFSSAMRLVGVARQRGYILTVADVLLHPKLSNASQRLRRIEDYEPAESAPKASLQLLPSKMSRERLEAVLRRWDSRDEQAQNILPVTDEQARSLSMTYSASQSMLFYHAFDCSTDVDLLSMIKACSVLVSRFDILRTVFIVEGDSFLQVVLRSVKLQVPTIVAEQDEDIETCMTALLRRKSSKALGLGVPPTQFYIIYSEQQHTYRGLGSREIVRSCTDWSQIAYYGTVIRHNSYSDDETRASRMHIFESLGSSAAPIDIDNVEVHIIAVSSNDNINVKICFAANVIPADVAYQLAADLQEIILQFYNELATPLHSLQELPPLSCELPILSKPVHVNGIEAKTLLAKGCPPAKTEALRIA
ncbi:hypothetical protein ARSEF4850_005372 [Beauveria asiatica]